MDVAQVASELYGLRPDEFTAARNTRSRQLTAAGDPKLAAAVRAIPKPSVAAWAINSFASGSEAAREDYVDLGDRLRAAQAHPDRATLTKLVGERRSLVAETVTAVRTLAAQHGITLSPSALNEVEQSFHAAAADNAAAAATFSGRLVRGLTSDGVEPVDLAGAVAGTEAPVRRARSDDRQKTRRKTTGADARKVAAAEAASSAADAETALAAAKERLASLDEDGEQLAQDARDLQDRFRMLEERQADFDERKQQLHREHSAALEDAQKARRVAKSAHARLR